MATTIKPSTMKYNGYVSQIEFDDEAEVFFGKVIGTRDAITFQGKSVDELKEAFHDAVDAYRAFCEKKGREPEKSFSGKIPFRTTPEIHQDIYKAAQLEGKSVNAWMNNVLAEAALRTVAIAEQIPSAVLAGVQEQIPLAVPAGVQELLSNDRIILEALQQLGNLLERIGSQTGSGYSSNPAYSSSFSATQVGSYGPGRVSAVDFSYGQSQQGQAYQSQGQSQQSQGSSTQTDQSTGSTGTSSGY